MPYKYKEEYPFEEGFAQYYEKYIVPLAEKYEVERIKQRDGLFKRQIIAVISGIGLSVLMVKSKIFHSNGRQSHGAAKALLLPPIVAWWFFIRRPRNNYFDALKEEVLPKILAFMGEFHYEVKGKFHYSVIQEHVGLANFMYGIAACEDIITYKKEGVQCRIYERTFWTIHDGLKSGYVGSIFIELTAPFDFEIDAVIFDKENEKFHQKLIKKRGLVGEKIPISGEFDEVFSLYQRQEKKDVVAPQETLDDIFSSAQREEEIAKTEPPKWLEQEFINELYEMNKLFDRTGLSFSIKGNKIVLQLQTKRNLFEPGTSFDDLVFNEKDIKALLKELDFVIKLSDKVCERGVTLNRVASIIDSQNGGVQQEVP